MKQNEIEHQVVNTFQNNIVYFQNNHPLLYAKIIALNSAIQSGTYKENYTLEYINDYFDVLEVETKQYLYSQNSFKYSKKLAKNVNYKKSQSTIDTFYKINYAEDQIDKIDKSLLLTDETGYTTAKLINYTNKFADSDTHLKQIYKYIFFGVGLGLHIENIVDKINLKMAFVIEDNLELFRLSLFVTNYVEIAKSVTLYFSVMENQHEFKNSFEEFYNQAFNYNHYLKYSLFSNDYMKKIKQVQSLIVTQVYLSFPYSKILKQQLKSPEYLIEKFKYIDISMHYQNTIFSKKPVLIIGAGPSLDYNLAWLKKNHQKFIVVSVLATLKTLYNADIKPDIVTSMDAGTVHTEFLSNLPIDDFLSETLFVLSSVTHNSLINMFPKERVYIFESISQYKQNFGSIVGTSIGETTYGLSLILGAKDIYLLGLDFALDPETRSTHSKHHIRNNTIDDIEEQFEEYTDIHKTLIYVKGNFIDNIPTIPALKISIFEFKRLNDKYKLPVQKVYNLSNGAYLDDTISLRIKDVVVQVDDTKISNLQIQDFFESISEDEINQADISFLEEQLNTAKDLLYILETHKKTVSKTSLEYYLKDFAKLTNLLSGKNKMKNEVIHIIMFYYVKYTSSYIFDFFDTKELTNTKKHIKNIDKIFIFQIEKMLDLFIKTFEVYIFYTKKELTIK